jgi:anionic cell wall polymer biosynthesis LytR-Cps2A-Psr (LCP) family protein
MTSASAPLRRARWALAGGFLGLLAVVAVPALVDPHRGAALLLIVEDAHPPDSPPDRARGEEARADAVILLRPEIGSRHTTSVTSLPRDLVLVPGAEPITIGFGTRGAKQLGLDVAAALRVDVAAVAVIDLADVARLADSVGPVTVELGTASRDLWTGFSGGPGSVALDGSRTVAYLRSRHWEEQDAGATWVPTGGGDQARQERLHRFLAAAVARIGSVGALGQLRLGAGLLGRARLHVLHPTALPDVGRGLAATSAVTFATLAVHPERPLDELRSPFAAADVGGARNVVLDDTPADAPSPLGQIVPSSPARLAA